MSNNVNFYCYYRSLGKSNDNALFVDIISTTDNFSSEVTLARARESNRGSGAGGSASASSQTFVDVTDTSNVKVKFATVSFGEKEIDPKTGLVKYRRSRDGKLRPVMKKRYRGGGRGIESDMW